MPAHLVLDSEGLSQLSAPRPSPALLVALEAAAATGGRVSVPTSVVVEQRFERTDPRAAKANRRLRIAGPDVLDEERAASAVRLLLGLDSGASVVDAHAAAAAHHLVRSHGGTAAVATSDPSDLRALIDSEHDHAVGSRVAAVPL